MLSCGFCCRPCYGFVAGSAPRFAVRFALWAAFARMPYIGARKLLKIMGRYSERFRVLRGGSEGGQKVVRRWKGCVWNFCEELSKYLRALFRLSSEYFRNKILEDSEENL